MPAGLGLLGWWLQQTRHAHARWPVVLLVSVLTLLLVPLTALADGGGRLAAEVAGKTGIVAGAESGRRGIGRGAAVSRITAVQRLGALIPELA